MEELKLLIEMVANLPAMAMWVLVGFFAYKVIIVGSIYGVIKFIGARLFNWLEKEKTKPIVEKEIRMVLDGMVITGQLNALITQLHRLRTHNLNYIHGSDIEWLRQAIDDKIAKDGSR